MERDLLLAGRARARERVAALEREFAGLARMEFIASASRRLAPAEGGTVLQQLPPVPIEDLARAQHARPVHDPVELGDDIWESDDELAEFLADLRLIRTLALG